MTEKEDMERLREEIEMLKMKIERRRIEMAGLIGSELNKEQILEKIEKLKKINQKLLIENHNLERDKQFKTFSDKEIKFLK